MELITKLLLETYKINPDILKGGLNNLKIIKSNDYNYIFNIKNGCFVRCGKTIDENPKYSPFGPELFDIEISTICSNGCKWCYKNNTKNGKNMSFETFKSIIDKIPNNLTQIAFGIGNIDANKDLEKILIYCREKGFIPNITINGKRMNNYYISLLSKYCGAIAISKYEKDLCYNMVELLCKQLFKEGNTLNQVNIHQILSMETYEDCMNTLIDKKNDYRLKNLNAIVFLLLKPKGNRNTLHTLKDLSKFDNLVKYALENSIQFGFDSCSSPNFSECLGNEYKCMMERCESSLFSLYCNVDGIIYPCSFMEDENIFKGINIIDSKSFIKDVWFNSELIKFRNKLIDNERKCFTYDI